MRRAWIAGGGATLGSRLGVTTGVDNLRCFPCGITLCPSPLGIGNESIRLRCAVGEGNLAARDFEWPCRE
jgi:hypothetical protein